MQSTDSTEGKIILPEELRKSIDKKIRPLAKESMNTLIAYNKETNPQKKEQLKQKLIAINSKMKETSEL